jgi:hypothetical protein
MKYLKMLGLAAIAALALTAMAGAGTASAATVLCTTNANPCPVDYGKGTKISAQLKSGTEAILTAGFGSVRAKTSTLSGEITSTQNAAGTPEGVVTALTFGTVTGPFGESCSTKALNLPWKAEVHTTEAVSNGNGTLTVFNPKVTVNCGFTVKCNFSTEKAVLHIDGGNPAFATANKVSLAIQESDEGGSCPGAATWTATYEITAPKPLFVI